MATKAQRCPISSHWFALRYRNHFLGDLEVRSRHGSAARHYLMRIKQSYAVHRLPVSKIMIMISCISAALLYTHTSSPTTVLMYHLELIYVMPWHQCSTTDVAVIVLGKQIYECVCVWNTEKQLKDVVLDVYATQGARDLQHKSSGVCETSYVVGTSRWCELLWDWMSSVHKWVFVKE